jgi:hypothetical protein
MPAPRYERTSQLQPGAINRSAGAPGEALSQELERFQSMAEQRLNQRAQETGYQEGLTAGTAGDLGPDHPTTVRARAFQQGAMVAHQAALQTDIRNNVARFQDENPYDPDAFDAQVKGLSEGLLKEADPTSRAFIQQRVADYAGAAKVQILHAQQVKLRTEAINDLDVGVQGLVDDATTAAFEGNVLMTEARRKELFTLLDQGHAGDLIDLAKVTELKGKFEREVTSQEVVGNFDRLLREQGDAAATDAIRRWQGTKGSDVGLTSDDHEAVTRQMVALKNRSDSLAADDKAKLAAGVRAEQLLRSTRVKDSIEAMRQGFAPQQEQAQQTTADLRWLQQTGALDPTDLVQAAQLAHDYDTAAAIQSQVHAFRRMPPQQQGQTLNQLRAALTRDGASAEETQLYSALQQTHTQVAAQLDKDPRGYLQGEAMIEDQPLDFSSAENLAKSVATRTNGADVGQHLTGEPTPLLTADEADQFATLYQQGQIEEKAGLLGILAQGDTEQIDATLKQLDAKGYKDMALLGSMVRDGRGQLAREIMLGQQVRGSQKQINPKTGDGYQADIDDAIGSALIDWPEQRATYTEAALSKYAELKASSGDASDVYQPRLMQQAIKQVMPTAEVNGRRVLIPSQATEDSFRGWFKGLTDADFTQVAGAPVEGMASLVQRRGRLAELGQGRYGVAISSAADDQEKILLNHQGEPFVLEYGKPGPHTPEPHRGRSQP